jgi:hypothetical protein
VDGVTAPAMRGAALSPLGLAAMAYAVELGWPVFPLNGKEPRTEDGFKSATVDPDRIGEWWRRWPDAGIGFVPGRGGFVVFDLDGPEAEGEAQALGLLAEPTRRVLTARGEHRYYRHPGGTIGNRKLSDHIDVRADSGYVVLPPSVHPSGAVYAWGDGATEGELPPRALAALESGNGHGKPVSAAALPDRIPEGQRNATLASLAGSMRRRGASAAAIVAALEEENAARCDPPLTGGELAGIAASVGRYAPAPDPVPPVSERAGPPALEPFAVVRVLEGEAPDPPAVLVADLLVAADVNEWVGFGGAYKTVLALVTVVCVALGRDVFGSLTVRRSGPVLLVCPEDGQAAVRMMLDAIIEGLELDADDRARLAVRLVMVVDDAVVNLGTDTRKLMRTAQAHGAVLVLLDPLRNLLGGGDENDNALAGACLDALRRDVCREAGAAVLINHHSRKPGKDAGPDMGATAHDARGASAWIAGARLVFGVTAKGGRVTLRALKANRLRSDQRHELIVAIDADPENAAHWLSVTVTDANAGARSEGFTPGVGRDLNPNERATLAALDDAQEPNLRLSYSGWSDASGLKPDTWKTVRARLLKGGLCDAIATGKKTRTGGAEYAYAITERGRRALASGAVSDTENEGRRGEGVSNG